MILGLLALIVVLLGAIGGVWAYYKFLYTKPLTQTELAELTPDWSVVTHGNWSPWVTEADGSQTWNPAASFNAWLATVPEEDKAWPVMVRVKEKYTESVLASKYLGTRPNDEARWELIRDELGTPQSDEILSALKDAFAKPVLGCVLSTNYGPYEHAAIVEFDDEFEPGPLNFDPASNYALMDIMQGWLGMHRSFTNFLESKAAYELEQGNVEEFVEIVVVLMRSSDLCLEYPTLIGQLVEVSIENVGLELIGWAIENHQDQLTEDHLQRFDIAISEIEKFELRWQGEALMFHDTIRRLMNSNGVLVGGTGSAINGGASFGDPVSLQDGGLHASSQRTLLVYNSMLQALSDISRIPWDTSLMGGEEIYESQKASLSHLGDLFLGILGPATDSSSKRFRQIIQQATGLRVGIAVNRHRLRHGRFPDSLDSIDTDLMVFNPIDVFTDEHLFYVLTESGPVVYSVSDDRVDNGGVQLWTSRKYDKLVNHGEGLAVIEVDVYRMVFPEWYDEIDAHALFGPHSDREQGDWVLFPIPENDPRPLDNFDWDENGELFIEED
ncbi:hypothetical protein COB72_06400 [bacterium]|nr:MAG: hypothetical protein COB72_06400 [bacterium]